VTPTAGFRRCLRSVSGPRTNCQTLLFIELSAHIQQALEAFFAYKKNSKSGSLIDDFDLAWGHFGQATGQGGVTGIQADLLAELQLHAGTA